MNFFRFGIGKERFIPLVIERNLLLLPLINGVNYIIDSWKKIINGDVRRTLYVQIEDLLRGPITEIDLSVEVNG